MWDLLLVAARSLQFAGALVLLGSSLFCMYGLKAVLQPLPAPSRWQWPKLVLVVSALAAVAGTVLWVMAETVLFSGESADGTRPAAVWVVFSETHFGRVCLWRIGLLLVSLAVTTVVARGKTLWLTQVLLATVIIATFAWTGHGASTAGWPGMLHLGGDIVHLWVAGVWFGALPPLAILIVIAYRTKLLNAAQAARYGLGRFSDIGTAVVTMLVLSGLINSWFLIGRSHWREMGQTSYGVTLLIKIALFAMMLVLAAANRFWLTPGLQSHLNGERQTAITSLRILRISVLIEAGIAILIVVAVGVLGTLAPPGSGE